MIREVIGDKVYSTNTLGNSVHDKNTGHFTSEKKHSFANLEKLVDKYLDTLIEDEKTTTATIFRPEASDINSPSAKHYIRRFVKKNKDILNNPILKQFTRNPDFDTRNEELNKFEEIQEAQQLIELSQGKGDSFQSYDANNNKFDREVSVPYFEKLFATSTTLKEIIGSKLTKPTNYEDNKIGIDFFGGELNPHKTYPILDESLNKIDLKTVTTCLGGKIEKYNNPAITIQIGKIFSDSREKTFVNTLEGHLNTHFAYNILYSDLKKKDITHPSHIERSQFYFIPRKDMNDFVDKNGISFINGVVPKLYNFPNHEETEDILSTIAANNNFGYEYGEDVDNYKDIYRITMPIPEAPEEKMIVLFEYNHNPSKKDFWCVRIETPCSRFGSNVRPDVVARSFTNPKYTYFK